MATRRISGVQFNGEAADLQKLIGRWSGIKGCGLSVLPTDFVGGSFDVTFTREGEPITKSEAQAWVNTALKHAS